MKSIKMTNSEVLFKPNGLIMATASDSITASEYKLFDSLLQRCQIIKDNDMRYAMLTREEIKGYITDPNRNTIEQIKITLEKFMKIIIRFKIAHKHTSATLISAFTYDEITDEFICSMHEEVYVALIKYAEIGYSPIDLKLVRQARGYYTQKIYGMLRTWSRENKNVICTYSLDEIKNVCDIKDGTSYDRYINLKNKVIKPAIKEINEKLNMEVTFKENKVSRSVVSLTFCIVDHEPRYYNFKKIDSDGKEVLAGQIGIEESPAKVISEAPVIDVEEIVSSVTMKAIEELQRYKIKISAKTLERNLNTYGEDIFKRSINTIINQKESGKKITAPVGYLNGILEKLKANAEIAATKAQNEGTKPLKFNDYSQREYDYDLLEKQLLGWDD